MGGKAAVRKAPAGKSAKMLDSTEALNLRAKAAFDHSQRQEQRKPAAKRCVQATAACVCVLRARVCVCMWVWVFKHFHALQAVKLLHHIAKQLYQIAKQSDCIATFCRLAIPHCKIAIPHGNMHV